MNLSKYNKRKVTIHCPACNGTQISYDSNEDINTRTHRCVSCGGEFTYEELIEGNKSNINKAVSEVGNEIVSDIVKDFNAKTKKWK